MIAERTAVTTTTSSSCFLRTAALLDDCTDIMFTKKLRLQFIINRLSKSHASDLRL